MKETIFQALERYAEDNNESLQKLIRIVRKMAVYYEQRIGEIESRLDSSCTPPHSLQEEA